MISTQWRARTAPMRWMTAALFVAAISVGDVASAQLSPDELAYRQRMEERIAALDTQIRRLTGKLERTEYELRNTNRKVDSLTEELAAVRAEAAARPVAPPTEAPSQDGSGAAAEVDRTESTLPTGEPQSAYNEAYGLLGQGKFAAGEQALRGFLNQHPDHQLADNARYWIGESLYARQLYQDAATAFLEGWQANVNGPKAPDNLLKLGMAMSALEKNEQACASFNKLLADYRGAPTRIRTAASRESKSLGCP